MQFALSLKLLWSRRVYVTVGLVAALALTLLLTFHTGRQQRVWVANSVLIVDSNPSALGDITQALDPLIPRATVYANLMTSPEVVDRIGVAARIPADEIAVSGPVGINGQRPQHGATVLTGGAARYTLQLNTDETQPLIRITAKAPTSATAVALATGAATGLTAYVAHIESSERVPAKNRIDISDLGQPSAGSSDTGLKPVFGIAIFAALAIVWCMLVLLASRFRQTWRLATEELRYGISTRGLMDVIPRPMSTFEIDDVDRWGRELPEPEPEPEPEPAPPRSTSEPAPAISSHSAAQASGTTSHTAATSKRTATNGSQTPFTHPPKPKPAVQRVGWRLRGR